MRHEEYAYTRGMDTEEQREQLAAAATGVLALAEANDAYAVPMAHYFDGDRLFLRFGVTDRSRKRRFWDRTETASYLVYETEAADDPRELDSWSVVIRGHLRELPPEEQREFSPAEINRRFPPIRIFGEPIIETEIKIAEFEIEEMTGRTTADPR